jgi:hypothetical protein
LLAHEYSPGLWQQYSYALADLPTILGSTDKHIRDWLVSVCIDISHQSNARLADPKAFHHYDSLNVGPLRTEEFGECTCFKVSDALPSVIRSLALRLKAEGNLFFENLVITPESLNLEALLVLRQA